MASAGLSKGNVRVKKNGTLGTLPGKFLIQSVQQIPKVALPVLLRGKNKVVDVSHKFVLLLKAKRYFTRVRDYVR